MPRLSFGASKSTKPAGPPKSSKALPPSATQPERTNRQIGHRFDLARRADLLVCDQLLDRLAELGLALRSRLRFTEPRRLRYRKSTIAPPTLVHNTGAEHIHNAANARRYNKVLGVSR